MRNGKRIAASAIIGGYIGWSAVPNQFHIVTFIYAALALASIFYLVVTDRCE